MITRESSKSSLALASILESCGNESFEEGVGRGRLALKFWVKLNRDEERMVGDFNDFAKSPIRRCSDKTQAGFFKLTEVVLIELVAVAVAFVNCGGPVEFV